MSGSSTKLQEKKVDEQLDQARRKVLASVTELRFLAKKYGDVFARRNKDQEQEFNRTRRFRRMVIKGNVVHVPFTRFARGFTVQVLAGDFDRAVALIKKIKMFDKQYPQKNITDDMPPRELVGGYGTAYRTIRILPFNKRATATLGELLKAKLDGLA